MCDWWWLSAPFLRFAWLEQIGELFDGKNALLLILAHHPCCHAIEQTEVILLFRLGLAQALKGAERTMLIQDEGRWCRRVSRDPFVQGLKKRSEGFGTLSQFDGVRCTIHPDNFASHGQCTLEALQHIPDKGQRQLLLFADAMCPHNN